MGEDHLPLMFALLQSDAICLYPEYALQNKMIQSMDDVEKEKGIALDKTLGRKRVSKSLSRLSQQFLQVFLVGFESVSLADASDMIHGTKTTFEELAVIGSQGKLIPDDYVAKQRLAAKGLKTKIRRLYDIANVFHAIGYLEKVDDPMKMGLPDARRPVYRWTYTKTFAEIRQASNEQLTAAMRETGCPFATSDRDDHIELANAAVAISKEAAMNSKIASSVEESKSAAESAANQRIPDMARSCSEMLEANSKVLANIHQSGALSLDSESTNVAPSTVSIGLSQESNMSLEGEEDCEHKE